jgi:carboxyl-terminal processing protease
MPRTNFYIILFTALMYVLCSGMTLRDRVLIDSLHRIERSALFEPTPQLLFEGAMTGLTNVLTDSLGDDYSMYIPNADQTEYEEDLNNRFDGIGVMYRVDQDNSTTEITYPILNSPAYRAGLRSGDRIMSINGKSTEGKKFNEVTELFRRKTDQALRLSVLRLGETEPIDIVVRPDTIQRDSVEGDLIDSEGNRIFHLETDPKIGYIRITSFSEKTAQELRDARQQIKKEDVCSLILDLRDNPGGYVDTSVEIAGMFLKPTPEQKIIVTTRYRSSFVKGKHELVANSQICSLPMAVLIDGETASSAEILTAALQDYHRVVVVGTRSFGKGIVQDIFVLPFNSGMLQLTDASYWRPSGKNIHRGKDAEDSDEWGVTPDAEGLVPISDNQRLVSIQFRDMRSNAVSDNRDAVLEQFKNQLTAKINLSLQEKESSEPFELQGCTPYFDPQLDRAIDLLQNISRQ